MDGRVTLSLAEKVYISENLTTYTFFLKNLSWSDGTLLTAYDFEKSWKEVLEPDFLCPFVHLLFPIKNAEKRKKGLVDAGSVGIFAKDAKTLIIELKRPTPYFLEITSFCPFFPLPQNLNKEQLKKPDKNFPCIGAFKLFSWSEDTIRVVKNPLSFNSAKISGIQISMIEDPNLAFEKYIQDELDIIGEPISPLPPHILKAHVKEQTISPIVGTRFCSFNSETFFFQNVNMRRAFHYAIPRKELLKDREEPAFSTTTAPIPSVFKNEEEKTINDNDILALKHFEQALKELKIQPSDIKIPFIYESSETHRSIAKSITKKLQKLFKIEIFPEEMEFKAINNKLISKEYQFALTFCILQCKDPLNMLERFKYKELSKNYTNWENQEFISLLDKASKLVNVSKRRKMLAKAEELLMQEAPIAPISHFSHSFLQKPYVKSLMVSPFGGIHFEKTYIDKKVQKEKETNPLFSEAFSLT